MFSLIVSLPTWYNGTSWSGLGLCVGLTHQTRHNTPHTISWHDKLILLLFHCWMTMIFYKVSSTELTDWRQCSDVWMISWVTACSPGSLSEQLPNIIKDNHLCSNKLQNYNRPDFVKILKNKTRTSHLFLVREFPCVFITLFTFTRFPCSLS